MNDLRPKIEPENPSPENFPSISKKVPDNTFDEGSQKVMPQTQELPQQITSTEIIDIRNSDMNDPNNIEKFMNTNGAEISRILKNPNDVSQNLTNMDILGMPSIKTDAPLSDNTSPPPSDKILTLQDAEPVQPKGDLFGDFSKQPAPEPPAKQPDFEFVSEPPAESPKPAPEPEAQVDNDGPILEQIAEPGPPKEAGGFDDIFDNVDFNNQDNSQPPVQSKESLKEKKEDSPVAKKPEEAKNDDESFDDQYYSPNYYQDTGGYDDEGGSNYYQNNYYGGGSDYEDEGGEYETYKRDDTAKEEKEAPPKKQADPVDFL